MTHLIAEKLLDGSVARLIQIGRRLVEDEDAGILQQRAREAQELPLARGEVGAALAHLTVEHLDRQLGAAQRVAQRLGVDLTEGVEVVRDRALVQHRILWNDCDGATEGTQAQFHHVDPINMDRPRCGLSQAEERQDEGALACARASDNAALLTRANLR